MSAADQAMAETMADSGPESATPENSGDEGGSIPASPEGSAGAAPSRPEYLLEGYADDRAQAEAHHKFVQQYGGQHDYYAQQGAWMSQRYYNDPVFKEWVDNYNRGGQQQQAPPKQDRKAPFDPADRSSVDKYLDGFVENPLEAMKYFKEEAVYEAEQKVAQRIAKIEQAQKMIEARRLFNEHKDTLREMQQNQFGQQLLAQTNQGLDPEQAIAQYNAAKRQFSAQQAQPTTAAPPAQQPVRDSKGRFERVAGNGRRAGTVQRGKSLTTDEILAETLSKKFN